MQIGSENRTKLIAASVLGAIALLQVVRMAWPSGPSAAPMVAATSTVTSATTSTTSPAKRSTTLLARRAASESSSLDPTLLLQTLHSVEGISYNGSGRNIFVEQPDVVIPKVEKPVAVVNAGPPLPPPPPAITLKFFGFASRTGEAKKVFLSEGDDVFIAAEGDIVNRRYKVVHIGSNAVEIEDVLYNHSQSIPLTQS